LFPTIIYFQIDQKNLVGLNTSLKNVLTQDYTLQKDAEDCVDILMNYIEK